MYKNLILGQIGLSKQCRPRSDGSLYCTQKGKKLYAILAFLSAVGLKDQSDQGLHCLPFHYFFWTQYYIVKPNYSVFFFGGGGGQSLLLFYVSQYLHLLL